MVYFGAKIHEHYLNRVRCTFEEKKDICCGFPVKICTQDPSEPIHALNTPYTDLSKKVVWCIWGHYPTRVRCTFEKVEKLDKVDI